MEDFTKLVARMRDAQKLYEYSFDAHALEKKKQLEAEVDNYIRSLNIGEYFMYINGKID